MLWGKIEESEKTGSCQVSNWRNLAYVASALQQQQTDNHHPSQSSVCTGTKCLRYTPDSYSACAVKTSNDGPSEERTTSLQRTAHLPPIDFTIELIHVHYKPPRNGHLSTPNNGHRSAPDAPSPIQNYLWKWTVKLHPHNVDTCRPLS